MYLFHGRGGEGQLFCADRMMEAPATGAVYTGGAPTGNLALDYVMYHGYDGDNSRNVYGYTGSNAQLITTYVVWCVREGGTATPESYVTDARIDAIRSFYNDAIAYQKRGGGGSEQGCSVWWNAPVAGTQNLVGRVLKGGVAIGKLDTENGSAHPQGAASLAGAEYVISNAGTSAIVVGGITRQPGADVLTLVTASDGCAASANNALPVGAYTIRETKAPKGYCRSEEVHSFRINKNGEIAAFGTSLSDQVVRGDLCFNKVDGESMEGLAGVPFRLTSTTTGESHILVTDENGYATTESSWYSRSKANAADSLTSNWQPGGIWFYGRSDEVLAPASDARGALPYDTYKLEELRCPANEGHSLVSRMVTISRDATVVSLGTIDDAPIAIETTATNAEDGGKEALASSKVRIQDVVEYEGLTKGATYALEGTLMDAGSGTPVEDGDGEPVRVRQEFTPSRSSGSVEVTFEFDGSALGGQDVVCFERLLDASGEVVALHEDLSSEEQTISLPRISTNARANETDLSEADGLSEVVVVDTVAYQNLTPDEDYTLEASLVYANDGEPVEVEGKQIQGSTSLKPSEPCGTAEVMLTIPAEVAAGRSVVVYEQLLHDGCVIAEHTDINDRAQTIRLVSIATHASDPHDGDKEVAPSLVRLNDKVIYENLEVGAEYTISGCLMDKTTGEPVLSAEGEQITSEATFTPEEANGELTLEFEADLYQLADADVVVFEVLTRDGVGVASHADLSNEEQTLHVAPPASAMPKTGRGPVALCLMGIGSSMVGAAYLGRRRNGR